MKRKILMAVTTALSTLMLASCSACDACAGNTKVSFTDYYLKNADAPVEEVSETLTYSVKHVGANSYSGYNVYFDGGIYTTTLTKNADDDKYTLVSELSIYMTYEYGGVKSEPLLNTSKSTVVFYSAKNMLKPVSSEKTIVSYSPSSNADIQSVNDCYVKYEQTVKTDYASDISGGVSNIIDVKNNNTVTTYEFEIEDTDKCTYVDNEQLLFALRCMNPNSTNKVQAYAPFTNTVQTIETAFGSAATQSFTFSLEGAEAQSADISYYPVTLDIDAQNNGATKTAWIAEKKSTDNNVYRNVMLKFIDVLPYGLGELHYELVSADFAD